MVTRISRKLAIMVLIILLTLGSIPEKFGAGIGGISAVAAATNISSQDGIGYSGSIPGNEVLGTSFTGYDAWPSGFSRGSSAFVGGVYDGTSIWMIPYNADQLIKVNPSTGEMTGYSNWPVGFTKGSNAFAGGVYDGTNIWLIPYSANQVIKVNATTGVMTGYSDWPGGSRGSEQFIGGAFDGTHIWLTPYSGSRLIKVDTTTGAMTSYNSWPSRTILGSYPFVGSIFDGTNIWLIPNGADRLIKVDPATGGMTGFNSWPSGFTKSADAFWGGVFDGTNIWLIPYNATHVVKINTTTGVMTGYNGWPSGFTKGSGSFAGGVYDGTNIWMVPLSANMLIKVNSATGDMTGFNNWPSGFTKDSNAFMGGVYDGKNVWMIPFLADRLMKFGDSSNADLSSLTLSSGDLSPTFRSGTTSYTASVTNSVYSITVTPTVADAGSSVKVNGTVVTSGLASGTIYLNEGSNTITAETTAQDGETKLIYTVIVTRAAATSSGGSSSGTVSGGGKVTSTDGTIVVPIGSTGELSLLGEVTVIIPAGASDKELKITIEKLTDTKDLLSDQQVLISPVYEILKNVTDNFIKSVTLTFVFDTEGLKKDQRPVVFYYDEVKKIWVQIDGGKVDGNEITVEVDHFTKFAVMAVSKEEEQSGSDQPTFSDIAGHWAASDIIKAAQSGIVSGYVNGTFKPNSVVTRAEFVVMLMKALEPQEVAARLTFADSVKIGAWAQQAVEQAVQLGIVKGYTDGSFRPDAEITRTEMAVMIAKALVLKVEDNTVTSFVDDAEIPNWAKGQVAALKNLGFITGKGMNKFAPNDKATRAEAVTILLKVLAQKIK
jgi:hypothetical protein